MCDKELKNEKKLYRFTDRVIKRVQFYGYGKNNKYKSKPKAVCYWTKEGGCFVSYDASKIRMIFRRIRFNLNYYFRTLD